MALDDLMTPEVVARVKWREPHECGQHPHEGEDYCPIAAEAWDNPSGYVSWDPNWKRWDVDGGDHFASCSDRWAPLTEVMEAYAAVQVERERAQILAALHGALSAKGQLSAQDIRLAFCLPEPGAVSAPDVAEEAGDDSGPVILCRPDGLTVVWGAPALPEPPEPPERPPSVEWKEIPVVGAEEPPALLPGPCYLVRDGGRAMPVYTETIQPIGPVHLRITVTTRPPADKGAPT